MRLALFKRYGYPALQRVPALLGGHTAPVYHLSVGGIGIIVQCTEIIFATDTHSNDGVVRLQHLTIFKVNNGIAGTFVADSDKVAQLLG